MYILAADSSQSQCSVALLQEGTLLEELTETRPSKQAEEIIPLIQKLLSKHSVSFSDIDLLAATIGPGSFTGIRIGLSALKGIAIAHKTRTYGVTTLEAMAQAALSCGITGTISAAIDARRNQWFVQQFQLDDGKINALTEAQLIESEALEGSNLWVTNNPSELMRVSSSLNVHHQPIHPSAAPAGLLAHRLSAAPEQLEMRPFLPFYIRDADAKIPLNANTL